MYLTHFGFSERPFELSPNPKFFFLTAGYQSALSALLAGIKERKGWMVLSGEVGTGKTMMIHGLLARVPEKVKTAFIFHSTYRFGELLQQILSEAGETPGVNLKQTKIQFDAYLQKLKDRGEVLAVLIDESQKLAPEVVQEILCLLDDKPWVANHLQMILVGQPELDETLDHLLLRYHPRIPGLRITIGPLTGQESKDYMEHRLRVVGSSASRIFNPEAISLLTEYGKGIPRVINILCDNALLAGYTEGLRQIGAEIVWKVIENLEGHDNNTKKRFQPWSGGHPRQRPIGGSRRVWLVAAGLVLGGAGVWVLSTVVTDRPIPSKGLEADRPAAGMSEPQVVVTKPNAEAITTPKAPREKSGGSPSPPLAPGEEKKAGDRPAQPGRLIQVKKGDSLSKISMKYYGASNQSLIELILHFNPSIKEADFILENQPIMLPKIQEKTFLAPNSDHTYRILLGTFGDSSQTVRFKHEPALKGKKIVTRPRQGSGNETWARVEAGDYGTREEALAALKTLCSKKLRPFF